MATGTTSLLGLALPVDGELDGTWGDVVNDSITSLVDSAIAGTTTLSTDADVTLTTTSLAANQARQAVLLWTASNGATTRNITAPAQSKPYIVINAGTGSVVLRGAGPTTGITIESGEKAIAAWNGSDFVRVSGEVTLNGVQTLSNKTFVTLAVTGLSTLTGGAVVQGLTVGRGAGAAIENTVVGAAAMNSNTTGIQNVAVGYSALNANSTGNDNTGVGYRSLLINTGSNNTAIGSGSGSAVTSGANNVIVGGYTGSAAPVSATGSNWIVLSDGAGNVRQSIDSAGNAQFSSGALVAYAPAPASISTTTTLTNANIQSQIIVTTGSSYAIKMPLGTTLETLVSWSTTNLGYDFFIINTATIGSITLDATETGVTSIGDMTVNDGVSAHFRIRRTSANTFVVYRLT